MGRGSVLWLLLSILALSPALAQESLCRGGQGVTFWSCSARANGYTPGDQDFGDVAVDSLGNVLVTWNGESPACPEHTCYGEFVGQLYDAGGFPIGGEIVFNTHMYSAQWGWRGAAAMPGGGFVAAWADYNECGNINAQFLTPDGALIGENFTVSFSVPECPGPYSPAISTNSSGRWVTVWDDGSISWGQVFDGPTPHRNAFKIGEGMYAPDVAAAESGEFNVVTLGDSVLLHRYSGDGELLGAPIRVDGEAPLSQFSSCCVPKIAVDAEGNILVVWAQNGIFAKRFTWQGVPVGDLIVVSRHPGWLLELPDLAMDSAGNFVVVWLSHESFIWGQRFAPEGTRIGHEFDALSPPWSFAGIGGYIGASIPQVSMNDQGLFAITWHTPGDDGWGDQIVRVFDFNAPDFMRGDPDGDGVVDVSDVLHILGHLFLPGYPGPSHPDAADVNDDGSIDLSDAIYLLFNLFLSEPESLPHPYPYWGFDSTPDSLGE